MKISIDFSLCDGNGLCAAAAPALIEMGADDIPAIICEDVPPDQVANARAAVNSCPKAAVSLSE